MYFQYEQYKDFGAEESLLSTGGIICPSSGCGEGMVLEDNPGRNVRCANCQVIRGGFRKFCHRCYNFVNRHNRLLYYTLIERATFLLYNDTKTMHEKK